MMKIKEYKCCKCGKEDFEFIPKPDTNVVGIYCANCGQWFKWADKNEKNLMQIADMRGENE